MTTKAYLLGGYGANGAKYNDLWETTDGKNFTKVADLPYILNTNAYEYRTVSGCQHGNELIIGIVNNIYASSDGGRNWTYRGSVPYQETNHGFTIFSFNGFLWWIGGYSTNVYKSANNGASWETIVTGFTNGTFQYANVFVVGSEVYIIENGSFKKTSDFVTFTTLTTKTFTGDMSAYPSKVDDTFFIANINDGSSGGVSYIRKGLFSGFSSWASYLSITSSGKLTANGMVVLNGVISVFGGKIDSAYSNRVFTANVSGIKPATMTEQPVASFEPRTGFAVFTAEVAEEAFPLTAESSFTASSSFETLVELLSPLEASGIFDSVSGFISQANVVTPISDINVSSIFTSNGSYESPAEIVLPLPINGEFGASGQFGLVANLYDLPAFELKGNVVQNGLNYSGAKVIAIRDSDHKVFSTLSNNFGDFSLGVEIGNFYVMVVYQNGTEVKITEPKYVVVS